MGEGLSPTEVGREIGEHAERHAEGQGDRHQRLVSIVEAVLLSIVTITAAWSGYSAAKWGTPNLEVLREVAAACGLELTLGFARADDSYYWLIERQLELPPAERLARMLVGTDFDPLALFAALDEHRVPYVLIGEVAAVLHGCPLTLDRKLAITPRADDRTGVEDALRSLGATAQAVSDEFHGLHTVEPWSLTGDVTIEVVRTPAGTHGYPDLRRDARPGALGQALPAVAVASIADLARIAEASPRPVDQAWKTVLRRVAERTANESRAA